jgi:hypothetical protein
LWTATKRLLHFNPVSSPPQRDDGSWTKSDREKAGFFASYFMNSSNPIPPQKIPNILPSSKNSLILPFH